MRIFQHTKIIATVSKNPPRPKNSKTLHKVDLMDDTIKCDEIYVMIFFYIWALEVRGPLQMSVHQYGECIYN